MLAQGRRVTICQIMPVCTLSGSDEFPQLLILTNTSLLLISLVHMLQIPSPRLTLVFGVGACPLSFHFNVVKYINLLLVISAICILPKKCFWLLRSLRYFFIVLQFCFTHFFFFLMKTVKDFKSENFAW